MWHDVTVALRCIDHGEKVKSLPLLTVALRGKKDWTPLPEWLGPGSPTPVEGSN